MTETGGLLVCVLATGLLGWAAAVDLRQRRIPRLAGYGMLLLGVLVLIQAGAWLGLGCYVLAVWCSRGGHWRAVLWIGLAFALIAEGSLAPLLLGLLLLTEAFGRGWLGGGDAQLACGLVAVGFTDWVVLLLAGLTVLAGLGVMVWRGGGLWGGLQRLRTVWRQLDGPPDDRAVRSPYALVVLAAGVLQLWVLPRWGVG